MSASASLGDLTRLAAADDPYPLYRRLRDRTPVLDAGPFGWVVSRHEDALHVLGKPGLFSSRVMAAADATLLGADPPAHGRARRPLQRAFDARLAGLEGFVARTAGRLAGRLRAAGEGDLMEGLAAPLPARVLGRLLGLPPAWDARILRWSQAVLASSEPDLVAPAERAELAALDERCGALLERKGGGLLDELGGTSVARLLVVAGTETTAGLIGNAVLALLRHPDALARVRADAACAPAAVEETLRYDPPVQVLMRRTHAPAEVAGIRIPADALVAVLLGSANRDERRFTDPDRFELDRGDGAHLAFGHGPHTCLGQALARSEAASALRALLGRGRIVAPLGDSLRVERAPSRQLRGPRRLRLRFA